jgi:hypothetical protein
MTIGELYLVGAVLAFLSIFVTGRRLSRLRTTANTFLLTAHKMLSLAALILLAVTAARINAAAQLALDDRAAVLAAGILFVVTMVSGGLQSVRPSVSKRLRVAHRVTALLTVALTGLAFYFLLVRI